MNNVKLISGTSHPSLSKKISDKLGIPLCNCIIEKFSNSEIRVEIMESIRNKDVFICNVLKCRPPNNRDPLSTEVKECEPYLKHQINLIKPKLIVALGRIAGKTLLGVDNSLKSMRGEIHNYYDIPLIVTYHPAALLRNPNWKPQAWKDFKWIKSIIES